MADYTIEPGQNLDLTDPDDPVVEEDGEVVREPEPSNSDSTGNEGSEPEPDNNEGGGDSTSVVVTGDPGSEEGQTVVGTGDTEEEAQVDAASNPRFDAAKGSEIDRIEKSLGSDGQADSDSTSVVVTGGAGSGEPQQVVGQGDTTLEARRDAASNPRFDAAQGDPVDALESAQGQGQGDGTSAGALIQERRGTGNNNTPETTVSSKRKQQARQDQQRQEFQPFQRAQKLQAARQKRDSRVQSAKQEADLAGKSLITGVQIMQEGQDFAEEVSGTFDTVENIIEPGFDKVEDVAPENQKVQETLDLAEQGAQGLEERVTGSTALGSGLALSSQAAETVSSGDLTVDEAGDILETVSGTRTQRDIRESTVQGVATLGTQLTGLGIASAGAVPRALREDTPSLGEGVVEGATLTGEQVAKDPGEFIAEEAGEEAGEAIIGTFIAGGAGLALAATPTPEITPSIEARAAETERFIRGELGTQVEKERIVRKPFLEEATAESATFKRETKDLKEGGRAQQAIRIDPVDETVTVGQREERPVTRRDVVEGKLEAGQVEVDRFFGGNAVGLGPGGFLPEQETTPETGTQPEQRPDGLPEQDLFQDTEPGADTIVEDVSSPGRTRPPSLEESFEQDLGIGQDQKPGVDDRQEPQEEPPIQELFQETEQETTPDTRVEFFQETEQRPEQRPESRVDAFAEVRSDLVSEPSLFGLGGVEEGTENVFGNGERGRQESGFAPSLGGILSGEEQEVTMEEAARLEETEFTGLGRREPLEITGNGEGEEELNNLFGI